MVKMHCELINANCLDVFHEIASKHDNLIIVSDPPFNIGYHYNQYKDKMNEDDYYEMLGTLFGSYPSVVIHYPESLYKLAFQIDKFPES